MPLNDLRARERRAGSNDWRAEGDPWKQGSLTDDDLRRHDEPLAKSGHGKSLAHLPYWEH